MLRSAIDYSRSEAEPLDDSVKNIKGWTHPNERRFNQWFAREIYKGRGRIIDLGCMSGSSTAPLASGLVANRSGFAGEKVHAYDQFVKQWETIPGEPLEDIPRGGDFLSRFAENTGPWRDHIEVHREDIGKAAWPGEPIEFLLVDVMKSWITAKAIVDAFFPSVLVEDGHIVHQDFLHYYTPWIHLVMYRLRESIVPVFEIPTSCSLVFRVKKQPDNGDYARAVDFSNVTVEEVDETYRYSDSLVHKNSKAPLKAAEAMLYYHYAHYQRHHKATPSTFDAWMALAVERYKSIPADLRSHRDVPRTGQLIEPFMERLGQSSESKARVEP